MSPYVTEDFVKIEALKPGSNEYYDPVVAGNV
jgi:hypothetical protein